MTRRALTEASRAICDATAAAIGWARVAADEAGRAAAQARVEILTPIAKACSTDAGCEVASLGVQIHGGMGFIEETGAAQHRSEEHTSELQSLMRISYAVFCLKKKTRTNKKTNQQ